MPQAPAVPESQYVLTVSVGYTKDGAPSAGTTTQQLQFDSYDELCEVQTAVVKCLISFFEDAREKHKEQKEHGGPQPKEGE